MTNPRPLFGTKAFRLNIYKARKKGFRIFRAWRSCGCCRFEMAFRTRAAITLAFEPPCFATTVTDDMGNAYEAVNTHRGFVEVKRRKRPIPHLLLQSQTPVQAPL